MSERIEKLKKQSEIAVSESFIKDLNKVDNQITQIMRFSEKNCTKLSRHGIYQWSYQLSEAVKKKRKILRDLRKCAKIESVSIKRPKEIY